ncbi:titin-like, partial [Ostrinia furnacalis]|uniref:titin-like n=1 Tax=Ostrinia furnacalis TaxID=93504 RepID=UPI00103AC275
ITTEQEDDKAPVVSVHSTEHITDETLTPFDTSLVTDTAKLIEEEPEKVQVTQIRTDTGDVKTVKVSKRVIKKKHGPKQQVTEITTTQQDDEAPVTTVSVTEEPVPEQEVTPIETVELPEETAVEEIQTPEGKKVVKKTTKRIVRKKGPKQETVEVTTTQEDDKEPVTSVNIVEETPTEDTPAEVVELPEQTTVEELETPEGKTVHKKITKRIIKKKVGPKTQTTEITTEQEDDKAPVVSVHSTEHITDETLTPFDTSLVTDTAKLIEEEPEKVQVTQVRTDTGDVKTVKVSKRVIKKKHGPKQQVTEITTTQQDDEAPVTTVSVTEEPVPEQEVTPIETVELPEETAVEEIQTPEGKKVVKKTTKRIVRKKGPKQETVEVTTTQEDDKEPVTSVNIVEETPTEDTPAEVVELPEQTTVEELETPEGKTVHKKITKRIIKKKVGPKTQTTEITTEQEDDKAPVVSVHSTEHITDETLTPFDTSLVTDTAKLIEEEPEKVQVTQVRTDTGDVKTVKVSKRVIKKKHGPKQQVTEITTTQQDDEAPVTTVSVTEEPVPEQEVTPIETVELPEETAVEEIQTPEGKKVVKKTTKRIVRKKGPKQETVEVTTTQEDDKEPVTSVNIVEETPTEDTPAEVVELPEQTTVEELETPEGKTVHKKITKRIIKKKVGPKTQTTEITTEQEDDKAPVVSVHSTEHITDETLTPFDTSLVTDTAKLIEEEPEKVQVTQVRTDTGDVKTVKVSKRVIKKKHGPKQQVTEITTTQQDDEAPVTTVSVTEEPVPEQEVTPIETVELPEETAVEEIQTPEGKKVVKKTTKRIVRKKGPKQETVEVTTTQEDDKEPVTSVNIVEETPTEDTPAEVVELPEQTTVEELETPEGKTVHKKITKRIIKKKVGPKTQTTEITTEQEDDKAPVVSVHSTEHITDETLTPFDTSLVTDTAKLIEEEPEKVQVTQVRTDTGDVKTVKVSKRVIKKKHGPKQQVTEITTTQQDDEAPVTTVSVTEEPVPEQEVTPIETVELPEETAVEEIQTPEGKKVVKKTTKRIVRKKGPKQETVEVTTTQEDDKEPVTSVNIVEETPTEDTPAEVVELPEQTTVEELETPEGKTVHKKITKRIIKRR